MTTNNPQQAFYSLLIKCLDNNNEERKNAEMQFQTGKKYDRGRKSRG